MSRPSLTICQFLATIGQVTKKNSQTFRGGEEKKVEKRPEKRSIGKLTCVDRNETKNITEVKGQKKKPI